jgi:predicted cupin superfamily sugar epimerase
MEGGFFAETYRSPKRLPSRLVYRGGSGERSLATAIYYMVTPESCSRLHRLRSDEIYHFYLGDPVELLQLGPDGQGKVVRLGSDLLGGMSPQVVVPQGVWQGARLIGGGAFALLGTTMALGFDLADFEVGDRHSLIKAYPVFRELIQALT